MKRYLFTVILILLLPVASMAQDSESDDSAGATGAALGIHFGFHFFYPNDVNDYIENDLQNYMTTSGTKSMFLCFDLGLDSRYMFTENLGVKFGFDWLLAPKLATGDSSEGYLLSGICLSPTALAVIPIDKEKSIFIGAGPDYYFTWFEDYSGYGIAGHARLGLMLENGIEVSLLGRYAKIKNKKEINTLAGKATPDFTMDFSGVELKLAKFFDL